MNPGQPIGSYINYLCMCHTYSMRFASIPMANEVTASTVSAIHYYSIIIIQIWMNAPLASITAVTMLIVPILKGAISALVMMDSLAMELHV